jgi:hypothetical protein
VGEFGRQGPGAALAFRIGGFGRLEQAGDLLVQGEEFLLEFRVPEVWRRLAAASILAPSSATVPTCRRPMWRARARSCRRLEVISAEFSRRKLAIVSWSGCRSALR